MKSWYRYMALAALGMSLGYWLAKPAPPAKPIRPETEERLVEEHQSAREHWSTAVNSPRHVRLDTLKALAEKLPADEIEASLAELEFPKDYTIAEKILVHLAKTDGQRALDLLEGLPLAEQPHYPQGVHGTVHGKAVYLQSAVLREWAKRDLKPAMAYTEIEANSLPSWSRRTEILRQGIVAELAHTDPRRAAEFAKQHELQLPHWILADAGEAFVDEIGGIENERQRSRVLSYSLYLRAKHDPDGAYEQAMSMPPGSDLQAGIMWAGLYSGEKLVELMAHSQGLDSERSPTDGWYGLDKWARRNPQEALSWTDSLPENFREDARSQALIGAAMNDPEFALPKIEQLPEALRDQSFEALAPGWFHRDPSAALAWAESLTDPALSERVKKTFPE